MKRTVSNRPVEWHVFSRGPRRMVLFRDDEDHYVYLNILREAMRLSGAVVWVYTLMMNHYHLMVRATSGQLSRCMHHVNRMYSRYHNRKYGTTGHCFDGPYRAFPQWGRFLLFRRIAYIFLNPVAGGTVARPEDYRWSNFHSFMGLPGSPLDLDPRPALARLHPDPAEARRRFRRILDEERARPARPTGDRLTARQVQRQEFAWFLESSRRRALEFGDVDYRNVAIYWGREAGASPAAMAAELEGLSVPAVKSRLRWVNRRMKKDPAFARLLRASIQTG